MRILLVEDDPMIGKTLQQALQQDGYAVDWVTDGAAGRSAIATAPGAYALVLLDLGLPRKGGLELLRELAGPEIEHYHQAIALVVAQTFEQARSAAQLVRVDYVRVQGS